MATVRQCMNHELVYLRAGEREQLALRPILEFGISAVPVLDDDHRPVGVIALRDLVDGKHFPPSATSPALTVRIDEPLESAARAMAEANVHHLVVVDSAGVAAGMISSLDVVRGVLGMEAKHPKAITSFNGVRRSAE